MHRPNILKFILPFLFIGSLTVMGVFTFVNSGKTYSENEKRMLTELPKFSWESIVSGEYQKELESYAADHIPGRDFFVGVDAYFSKLLGKNTLSDIYYADGGYLINAPKEDTQGNFTKNIKNFQRFSEGLGVDSTLLIVPTAGYIMNDKLPRFSKEYADNELFVKADELTPDISFLDTRRTLLDAYKEGKNIYYRTDHHLTSLGSYEVYKAYCDFNNMPYPVKSDYTIETAEDFYGTTYSASGYWLTDADSIEMWSFGEKVTVTLEETNSKKSDTMFFREHLENKDKYPVFLDGNHSYVHIHNPYARAGNLLIVRDSYAQNLAPFLSHNYKNIYMIDTRYYRNSVKKLVKDKNIGSILYLYGLDTLITDNSSSWLFF